MVNNLKFPSKITIIMNGPSLQEAVNAQAISDEDELLVSNNFADSPLFESLRPSHYLIQDHAFWSHSLSKFYKVKNSQTFDNLINKTSWKINLYLPLSSFKLIPEKKLSKNPLISIYYYRDRYIPSSFGHSAGMCRFGFLQAFALRAGLTFIPPLNVFLAALFLSFDNGAKEITFMGVDFDWWKSYEVIDGQLLRKTQYFHKSEYAETFNDKSHRFPGTLSFKLFSMALTYQLLEALSYLFWKSNVKLLNASGKGCLQIYSEVRDGDKLQLR